jgi:CheY-like chemotaxis protein
VMPKLGITAAIPCQILLTDWQMPDMDGLSRLARQPAVRRQSCDRRGGIQPNHH